METYSLTTVRRGYEWLGHTGYYSEIAALHPEYHPGDAAWNRSHHAWPVINYVTSVDGVAEIVRRHAGERLVCYGLNPRPAILTKPDGRLRSATEADIMAGQNLVLDLDLEGTITAERVNALKEFLGHADEYFTSIGVQRPVRAATGRGSHLLFAYPPTPVSEVPDLRERLRSFRDAFHQACRRELARIEARLDSTQDLRRMVRVYGTTKPQIGYVSRFYGRARVEDAALRDHLLNLGTGTRLTAEARPPLLINSSLPSWFASLLSDDERLRQLWTNQGKPAGSDQTSSGYDYSLVHYLIRRGHTGADELGTILSLRPQGGVLGHRKGPEYVSRTVHNALASVNRRDTTRNSDAVEAAG